MIREYNEYDLVRINEIGSLIKDNFNEAYDIKNVLNYEWLHIFVYEEKGVVVGFIEIAHSFDNIDIYTIAVDEYYQKGGIGSSLIQYIKDYFNPKTITLEVRSNNIKAINLYQKNGFEIINIRKKYYGDIDAYVMQYNVGE